MLTSSARSIIERWFESGMVRSMYASACFSGNYASLEQPGSALPFFHMAIGELDGELGAWRLVKGGMSGGGNNKFPPSMAMDLMLRAYHHSLTDDDGPARPETRLLEFFAGTSDVVPMDEDPRGLPKGGYRQGG